MKKTLIYLILIIMIIPIHLLQIFVLDNFRAFNIVAYIYIIYLVFLGTYTNKTIGYIIAIIYGILFDISISNPLGITSIASILIIELTIISNRVFYVNSRIATMLKIFLLAVIYEFIIYFARSIIFQFQIELEGFIKIAIIEATYLALITMIIYPIYKYFGNIIDEKLNDKNVLTKYF